MLPVVELRGGLPYAAIRGVPVAWAFIICFAGNILPVPFILFFIRKIFAYLKRFKHIGKLVTKIEKRAIAKSDTVRKNQLLGLFLFVAIPLPGTGAWTGSLIAAILNLPIKKSFPAIALGVLCAGVIMVVLSYLIPGLFFTLSK
jgi:uncharacterized membrane protein